MKEIEDRQRDITVLENFVEALCIGLFEQRERESHHADVEIGHKGRLSLADLILFLSTCKVMYIRGRHH